MLLTERAIVQQGGQADGSSPLDSPNSETSNAENIERQLGKSEMLALNGQIASYCIRI